MTEARANAENNTEPNDSLPKYIQIANRVIDQIKSGTLKPGMKAPSENEIIQRYRVSNTTARKALLEIELEGWAKRIKGKGTFVLQRNVLRSVNRILSFTRNMVDAGYSPSTRVLESDEVDGYVATINGRRFSMNGPVYRVQRLRFADGTPMLLETRYISKQLCPGIVSKDLTQSLYEIYASQYRLELTEEVIQMSCIEIGDSEESVDELFGVCHPVPAFLIEGATFCGKGTPLEMEYSIYRGDKYHFSITATK
jgi:GntR family transcriptional regulator